MEAIRRNLKNAREADYGKKEVYLTSVLRSIRGMVEFCDDE